MNEWRSCIVQTILTLWLVCFSQGDKQAQKEMPLCWRHHCFYHITHIVFARKTLLPMYLSEPVSTLSEAIWTFLNLSEPIWTYLNLSELNWIYPNLSEPIQTYLNISKLIWTYPNLSLAIPTLSKLIWTYPNLSPI